MHVYFCPIILIFFSKLGKHSITITDKNNIQDSQFCLVPDLWIAPHMSEIDIGQLFLPEESVLVNAA